MVNGSISSHEGLIFTPNWVQTSLSISVSFKCSFLSMEVFSFSLVSLVSLVAEQSEKKKDRRLLDR